MSKGSGRRPESGGSYTDKYDNIFCGKKEPSGKAKEAAERLPSIQAWHDYYEAAIKPLIPNPEHHSLEATQQAFLAGFNAGCIHKEK